MYLDNGKEIVESDEYPGHFIDCNTGAWCDDCGNPTGGNYDNGDNPEDYHTTMMDREIVFISKTGKLYYPRKCKTASIPITRSEALRRHLMPSAGYMRFQEKKMFSSLRNRRRAK